MKKFVVALSTALSLAAHAQMPAAPATAAATTCETQAAEKKLAGAAKTSFLKKCEREAMAASDAQTACENSAADKKLAGAARNSYVSKCVKDATAPK